MKETAPLWSFRSRNESNRVETVPGPGAYTPTNAVLQTSPNYRVGTSKRKELAEKSLTPGPGSYNFNNSKEAPSWTL